MCSHFAMFYDVIKLYSSFSFILFLKLACITHAKYSLVMWDGKIMRSRKFKYVPTVCVRFTAVYQIRAELRGQLRSYM